MPPRKNPEVAVIIPAAGKGRRLGGAIPKQFLFLGGTLILVRTVRAFDAVPDVTQIVVVAAHGHVSRAEKILRDARLNTAWSVVAGGKHRQDSVWNGLQALNPQVGLVLVHDAVRPLVDKKTIADVIRQAARHGAAVVGLPVKDTVKVEGRKGFYTETLKRDELWGVQTPQGFLLHLICEAHRQAKADGFVGTDEASLVERLGVPVRIVRGTPENLKITTKDDLALAEYYVKSRM